jgi:hypothetical protein
MSLFEGLVVLLLVFISVCFILLHMKIDEVAKHIVFYDVDDLKDEVEDDEVFGDK